MYIKNIASLQVKVYEINTEFYCRLKKREFDDKVDLDGLVAAVTETKTYNQAPIHKHLETFKFESVDKAERGLFIIEFVGGGLSSRAVIKKGGLGIVRTLSP